jgi:hypothetical protein
MAESTESHSELFSTKDRGGTGIMDHATEPSRAIAVLLADIDGTVATKEKVITERPSQAVGRTPAAGTTPKESGKE